MPWPSFFLRSHGAEQRIESFYDSIESEERKVCMTAVIRGRTDRPIYKSETANNRREAIIEAVQRGVSLANADLAVFMLAGARLSGANLAGADLSVSNLTEACLNAANLTRAKLDWADLTRATLACADLSESDLVGAELVGADLAGANLRRADLTKANLAGAKLTLAQLESANLTRTHIDVESILTDHPSEVHALRDALQAGLIDGSGRDRACALDGPLAKAIGVRHDESSWILANLLRPAKRWFLSIRPGDNPSNSAVTALTVEWIDQWMQHQKGVSSVRGRRREVR